VGGADRGQVYPQGADRDALVGAVRIPVIAIGWSGRW